ncbi:MAG TPA: tetratricopeptide repeat protein [Thermoanaerobaculia bacterium]|nr:tetratricopeptide repeat protein [Thermoanaerobaculia bacterium]HUM30692.1 tetratricopeptide repeat protein [Thermoanaerobaculia bacterium]HXK68900.1 tetratricopeptide repeat protein [Thermoanaerobaculia bacterium]
MRRLIILLILVGLSACSTASSQAKQIAGFGTEMAKEGLWREAEFRWRQALELSPDDFRLYNNLAIAAEIRGDYDEALELYEKALNLNPRDKTVRKNYEATRQFVDSQLPDSE